MRAVSKTLAAHSQGFRSGLPALVSRCAIRNSKLHETPCICITVCRQGVLFLRMFDHV